MEPKELLRRYIRKQIGLFLEIADPTVIQKIKDMSTDITNTEDEITKTKKDQSQTLLDKQNAEKVANTQTGLTDKLKNLKTSEKKEEISYYKDKIQKLADKEKNLEKSLEFKKTQLDLQKATTTGTKAVNAPAAPSAPTAP